MNKNKAVLWAHRQSNASYWSAVLLGLGIGGWHWVVFVPSIFLMFLSFHFDNKFQDALFGEDIP